MSKAEGWAFLWNSRKWHYFRDSRSLCGKWLCFSFTPDKNENLESSDNCAKCKKLRKKELETIR